MQRFLTILAWRSRQTPLFRWSGAIFLSLVALSARSALGPFRGGNFTLTIYPTILLASVFLGWKEALLILGLLITAGEYWFLSFSTDLMPLSWLFCWRPEYCDCRSVKRTGGGTCGCQQAAEGFFSGKLSILLQTHFRLSLKP
jgi:hypothetical protein